MGQVKGRAIKEAKPRAVRVDRATVSNLRSIKRMGSRQASMAALRRRLRRAGGLEVFPVYFSKPAERLL